MTRPPRWPRHNVPSHGVSNYLSPGRLSLCFLTLAPRLARGSLHGLRGIRHTFDQSGGGLLGAVALLVGIFVHPVQLLFAVLVKDERLLVLAQQPPPSARV